MPPTEAAPIGGHPIRAANARSHRNHEAQSPYRRKVENGLSPITFETGNYPAGGWNRLGNPNGEPGTASQAEETDCPVRVIRCTFAMSARCPFSLQLPTHRYAALSAAKGQLETNGIAAKATYSITSSARPSSGKGTLRSKALAVLRLIASSNFVACITGKSLGLSPLRIRPAYMPIWRYTSQGLDVRGMGVQT